MIQNLTIIYEGDDLSGATSGVIYLPILADGELQSADVLTDEAQAGDAVFEVLLNGVVIDDLDALIIEDGGKLATISGLDVELVKGDEIILNLVSGTVSAPVTLNLAVEDGANGTNLPDGDLNAATNRVEKIQGFDVDLGTAGETLSQDFEDGTLDVSKFAVIQGSSAIADGVMTASGAVFLLRSTLIESFAGKQAEFAFADPSNAYRIYFGLCANGATYGSIYGASAFTGCYLADADSNGTLEKLVTRKGLGGDDAFGFDAAHGLAGTIARLRLRDEDGVIYVGVASVAGDYIEVTTIDYTGELANVNIFLMLIGAGGGSASLDIEEISSSVVVSEGDVADKSLVWFNENSQQFEPVTLAALKAALGASLPTVRTVTGTTATMTPEDNGNFLRFTNAAEVTLTVPADLSAELGTAETFAVGIVSEGAGGVVFEADTGVEIRFFPASHEKISGGGAATLIALAPDEFLAQGATE